MKFNVEEIFKRIEAQWKHVAYDPKDYKIYLLSDRYRCLDTKSDWFDFQDGKSFKKPLVNNRRVRAAKTRGWVYLGEK